MYGEAMIPAPEIRNRLLRAFSEPQADLLAEVLIESHAELVTRADFHELTGVVKSLATAQERTAIRVEQLAAAEERTAVKVEQLAAAEERTAVRVEQLAAAQERTAVKVEELAEAQGRTEGRLEELADAQRRTEGKVEELAEAQRRTEGKVAELAGAQRRTEGAVEELAEVQAGMLGSQQEMQRAIADLAKQVGGLSNAVGANLEDFACDIVPEILEKHWRLTVVSAGPEEVTASDGVHREFDVVVRGTIEGRPVVVLCEIKATVSPTEVAKFLRVVGKVREAHPDEDIRPLFFGYKAARAARDLIVQTGAAMIFTRGVMIPAA